MDLILEIPSTKQDFNFLIKEVKSRMEKERDKESYEWDIYRDILKEIYKRAGKDKEYLVLLEEDAEEDGYYTFVYEGTARIEINSQFIPEFPAFLVIPMFMAATLLAIFYNKKRSSHNNKQID